MAGKRILFAVRSPLGYRVVLTRDRWREITKYKHPALVGNERAVRACLESPEIIRESQQEAEVHMYYSPAGRVRLCVVVAPADNDERFVVTAYFTKNVKKGKVLWTS